MKTCGTGRYPLQKRKRPPVVLSKKKTGKKKKIIIEKENIPPPKDSVVSILEKKKDIISVREVTDEFVESYTGNSTKYDNIRVKSRKIFLIFY